MLLLLQLLPLLLLLLLLAEFHHWIWGFSLQPLLQLLLGLLQQFVLPHLLL